MYRSFLNWFPERATFSGRKIVMFDNPANHTPAGSALPPIDAAAPARLEFARFAMG
jgi:hypothetical protein